MTRARTWNLRLNLDELNAAYLALSQDQEKAMFMDGLVAGVNRARPNHEAPAAFGDGYDLGIAMRHEAETYREGRRVNGTKGGRPRGFEPVDEMDDFAEEEPCG